MWNARHDLISSHCSWCNRVWIGNEWAHERRAPGREIYAHGICEGCASEHFSENKDRVRMSVERFKMRPRELVATL